MIKKVIDYLYENGIVLMVIGFVMAVISILVYMQTRFYGNAVPQIAAGCTIAGFIIYVIGRVFMATRKRYMQKQALRSPAEKDEL